MENEPSGPENVYLIGLRLASIQHELPFGLAAGVAGHAGRAQDILMQAAEKGESAGLYDIIRHLAVAADSMHTVRRALDAAYSETGDYLAEIGLGKAAFAPAAEEDAAAGERPGLVAWNDEADEADPFDARAAAQDEQTFLRYLGLVLAEAAGDDARAQQLQDGHLASKAAARILGIVRGEQPPGEVSPYEITPRQIAFAVDTLVEAAGDDRTMAVRALVTFAQGSESLYAYERAFAQFKELPPTWDGFRAAMNTSYGDLGPYTRQARLGVAIGKGFAMAGQHAQASEVIEWTAVHHNPQMAVNTVAYTLQDTEFPDTVEWGAAELERILARYPGCNVNYALSVLTGKCEALEAAGMPNVPVLRRAIETARRYSQSVS